VPTTAIGYLADGIIASHPCCVALNIKLTTRIVGGVSAAVSKTAAAPIERVKLLIQNQVSQTRDSWSQWQFSELENRIGDLYSQRRLPGKREKFFLSLPLLVQPYGDLLHRLTP
jgi:hypothetical protein